MGLQENLRCLQAQMGLTHFIPASFLEVQLGAPERLQQLTLSLPVYLDSTLEHPSNYAS